MTLPDHIDILIVQDNQLEVELLLRPLREACAGLVIGIARDGEEALDYLLVRGAFRHRLGAPPPRLVLLDFRLPKLDAPDVVRAMRGSHRTTAVPVVILVPTAEPRELAQCYLAGANSCVRKPVEFAEFYAAMQGVGRYWLGLNETVSGAPAVVPPGP